MNSESTDIQDIELDPCYRNYYEFLLSTHLNPPRGYSGSATIKLAKHLRAIWPNRLIIGDHVLSMDNPSPVFKQDGDMFIVDRSIIKIRKRGAD